MNQNNIYSEQFQVPFLGKPRYSSPLIGWSEKFTDDSQRVLYSSELFSVIDNLKSSKIPLSFEKAGARAKLYFKSEEINCGIVTCGGLCPGINDVIRAIVYESYERYRVKKVYGFRFGYKGMVKENGISPVLLDAAVVNDIHHQGGTILSSSRGPQDVSKIVDYMQELEISILFTIGGDGTLRGAVKIQEEVERRGLKISIVGIPKTIDNDIPFVEKTFGFETAVELSRMVINSAHIESKGTENGVGLVKLMGRDAGFIAAQATVANADVNFCLIPEIPFQLEGEKGFLNILEKRLMRREHAVIVTAEGAGQHLMEGQRRVDASGNVLHEDIGIFLKDKITDYFKKKNFPSSVKYIDPSYIIRSNPANANDSFFCLQMGQNAVHAAMAGKTGMITGFWNQCFTHVPFTLVSSERKKVQPEGRLWRTVLSVVEKGLY